MLQIVGACFTVYNELVSGLLQEIYHKAFEIKLNKQSIPFLSQQELTIEYCGIVLKQTYRPDSICYDKIIVEFKPLSQLTSHHDAQVINYL